MSIQELVNIRELQASDLNFILSSSIKCLTEYTDSLFKGWNKQSLAKHLETQVLFILNNIDCSVFIACDANDSDHIFGYIVATKNNHILLQYTKFGYRELGLQKNLLMPLVIDESEPVTAQWGTKKMVKWFKEGKVSVVDELSQFLIRMYLESKEIK